MSASASWLSLSLVILFAWVEERRRDYQWEIERKP
jgi:hypothetical protein